MNPLLLLVTSVLFLGIGIFILIDHDLASRVLMIGIAIAIIVAGITHAVGIILNKHMIQGVLIGLAYVQPVYLYYLGFTLYLLHGFLHFGFYVQVLSEVLFAYKQSKSSLKAA